jgi:hypothetical protein
MLAALVDTDALWKIVLAALVAGVGVTAMYGQGVVALDRFERARREGRMAVAVANGLLVALVAAVCAAVVVIGFLAMTHK